MAKVLTAPLAKIKLSDSSAVVGKMRSIRVSENFRRGRVVGIGELTPSELPILEWSGTLNAGQYAIVLSNGIWNSIDRSGSSVLDFVKALLFDEGITISLITLVKNGSVVEEKTIATIQKAVLTSEGLDITESQIAGRDATFEYTTPMLYGGAS